MEHVPPPYTIDGDRVVFHEWADTERTEEHDESLKALVDTKRQITLDLTATKSLGTDWVRLVGVLIRRGDVRVVGATRENSLFVVDYLGQTKYWESAGAR